MKLDNQNINHLLFGDIPEFARLMFKGYLIIKDSPYLKVYCLDNVCDVTGINYTTELPCLSRELVMEGSLSKLPVPFYQITKDVGYANAYLELQTAHSALCDEIDQLEQYKRCLISDTEKLIKRYNESVADLKEYEAWYEKVTKFDEKSYDLWCKMKCDSARSFVCWDEEE